jgi:hypothetical protein
MEKIIMFEEWKDIEGFENLYQVSNFGNVKSLQHYTIKSNGVIQNFKERILQPGNMTSGYCFVGLTRNKKCKNFAVHRLVAKAFIPNPNNFSDINHKDGNKKNNHVENLEWTTRSKNLKHAVNNGLVKNQCKICRKVIVKRDEKTVLFETMKDCCAFFGFKKGWLHNLIRKHGLTFIYDGYLIEVSERGDA